jgi:hypothetical protein
MRKTALGLAGAALLCATPALADNTDTATVTVSGAIVAPLTITQTTALTMPHIARPTSGTTAGGPGTALSGGSGTVTVACSTGSAVVSYSAGVNPFAAGTAGATAVASGSTNKTAPSANFTGTCAALLVNGETGYSFLTTPGSGTVTGSPTGVSITATTCSSTASTAIASGGTTIHCGATVEVTSASTVTSYAGSFPVTVTYD